MSYAKLEKVICDTIKEEQIKLGYENETIRLYYPMSSLAHILDEEVTDTEGMDELLEEFALTVHDKLGTLRITHSGERYCIMIPQEGVRYIHETYESNPFLEAFIDTVIKNDCSLERILEVFHTYSDHVRCEKSQNDEFDYVIYFTDNQMDDYRYCIKFDHGHTVYHRFSKRDFEDL